jgi:hypothetical protein
VDRRLLTNLDGDFKTRRPEPPSFNPGSFGGGNDLPPGFGGR